MTDSGAAAPTYFPAIDGLRAVAVSLVFIVHVYSDLLPGGFVGVDIFFAISGFLITSILLRDGQKHGSISLGRFYRKRLLRIFPAMIVCFAFVAIFIPWTIGSDTVTATAAAILGFMNWLRALTPSDGGSIGHAWSLSIEEQFYGIWAVVLLLATRFARMRSLIWIALGLIVAVAAWRLFLVLGGASSARTFNGLDTRADAILAGSVLALIPHRYADVLRWLARFWIIPVLGMVAFIVMVPWDSPIMPQGGFTVVSLFSAWLLIVAVYGNGWHHRLLSSAPMLWMGKRSYSFYLWHMPIIAVSGALGFSRSVTVLPTLAIALLVAHLSYTIVEQPFLRMKDGRASRKAKPALQQT